MDANVKGVNVFGYFKSAFAGGFTGNDGQVSSNSAALRIRQYYVDLSEGFWEVLAGQALEQERA